MASYNRIILMGNLTRDPVLRYLPNQTAVVDIGLAVNHKYRTAAGEDREEVMFIDCTAFGKQAEVINQYCQKGRPLLVEGRLKLDTWDDKQTGQKRSKHKVVMESFSFIDSKGDGGENATNPLPPRPAAAPASPPASGNAPAGAPEESGPPPGDDDVPF